MKLKRFAVVLFSVVSIFVWLVITGIVSTTAFAKEEAGGNGQDGGGQDNAATTLDTVVVTSQRGHQADAAVTEQIEETRRNYPGSVATMTPEELELQKASNLGDILARIPGVMYVDEDGRGTKPDIGIRGLNPIRSEYVQVLHDGVPTQPSMYSEQAAYYGVPAERVAGIELYKGGSSILFGPNTVGGVINYLSRTPSSKPFAAVLDTRYDSNNDYLGNVFLSGTRQNTSYGLEYMHKGGDGFGESRDYDIDDLEITLGHIFNPDHTAQLHFQYYDEESETPGGLLPAQFDTDSEQSNKPNDFFYGERIEADLRTRHQLADRQSFETLFYVYSFERNWFLQNYVSNTTTNLALADNNGQFLREFNVYGFEPKYNLTYDLGGWADNTLTVGGRIYYDEINRRSKTGNTGTSRENDSVLTAESDLTTLVTAIYVQNEFKPVESLSIVPGVRYEHIKQTSEDVFAGNPEQSASYDVFVPGLGLKYAFDENMLIYANITKSFRPPTSGDSFDPTIVSTNFDLKSSTAWTYEAGLRANPHDWLFADLGVFYTDYSDQVVVSAGTASNFDTESYGFEGVTKLGLLGLTDALSGGAAGSEGAHEVYLLGGATVIESTFSNGAFEGNDLPYAANEAYTLGVQYSYRNQFDVVLQGRYLGDRFTDNANTAAENVLGTVGQLDDYMVFDIKTLWRVSGNLTFNAGVNNVTDEVYATQRRTGSQKGLFAGPSRTAFVSVTVDF